MCWRATRCLEEEGDVLGAAPCGWLNCCLLVWPGSCSLSLACWQAGTVWLGCQGQRAHNSGGGGTGPPPTIAFSVPDLFFNPLVILICLLFCGGLASAITLDNQKCQSSVAIMRWNASESWLWFVGVTIGLRGYSQLNFISVKRDWGAFSRLVKQAFPAELSSVDHIEDKDPSMLLQVFRWHNVPS